jgi:HK97 family phage major capsid protein
MPPALTWITHTWKAIDPANPGAMICFMLPPDAQQALAAAASGELNASPDHLTLLSLGPDASALEGQKDLLVFALADLATRLAPVEGTINGGGRFATVGSDGTSAVYATFDSPELPGWYAALCMAVEPIMPVERDHGFVPHITLGYLPPDAAPYLDLPQLPITFDSLSLIWAGQRLDLPLMGAPEADQAQYAGETMEDGTADMWPSPEAVAAAREQFAAALGVDTVAMPDYKAGRRHSASDLRTMQAIHDLSVEQGAACAPPSKALDPEQTLVVYGGAIKALGNGHIGGYLVRFGDPRQTDLTGDFFTKDTDFGLSTTRETDVYFNHRLPLKTRTGDEVVIKERIGRGTLTLDDRGVLIDAILFNRARYLADLEALGWSSGTAAHLVDREPMGKAMWIKTWALGLDASLTPMPAEPRAAAVPLKSLPVTPFVLPKAAAQAGGDPARPASVAIGMPALHSTPQRKTRMDEELKAYLESMFGGIKTGMDALTANNQAINDRLKAFEDSPALKSSGWVSPDGGTADKGVKTFADWITAVHRKDTKRLREVYKSVEVKDLNEGSGPAGGYLVPAEFEPQLQKIAAEAAIVEPRARQFVMNAASKFVPMLKQTATPSTAEGASAFFGGLVFTWNPEGASIDHTEPVFEMVELVARKLTGLTVSSNELREDAPTLESDLQQLFGEGLGHAKDFFYLRGNGVGKPLGVLNAPARYLLTRHASGNAVEMEDVSGMMGRMLPGSWASAIWVSHPLNISDIIQLKIGDVPVFQPDARGPIAGILLGRPIAFSEYASAPGTAGDLMLCDFMAYGVGLRRGIIIASSEHVRFDTDQITWRITARGDGQPLLDNTIKLADGANTEVSPFVVLS